MIRATALTALALAALALTACDALTPQASAADPPKKDAPKKPARTTPAPIPAVKPLPADVQRGVCLAHSWHDPKKGYGSTHAMAAKREMKALGADWLSLTVFGWQKTLQSTEVVFNPDTPEGESDARLRREVAQARQVGLSIMLKPHMHITPETWRGHIQPTGPDGWSKWFDSYTTFILHHARQAEALDIEAFVVGLELASSSWTERDEWVALIDAVRGVYSGKIVYAANWNEANRVQFWDKVDWIGIQFFPPLSDQDHPTYDELSAAIKPHFDSYEALSKHYGKPIVLTEFGYKSIIRAADTPNIWPQHLPDAFKKYDEHNQALAYTALLNAVAERPSIKGIYVWKWFTDPAEGRDKPLGFSPWGKRAMKVLGGAWDTPE